MQHPLLLLVAVFLGGLFHFLQHLPIQFVAPLNALPYVMEPATKAIVSASAMLANGSAVADIGTVGKRKGINPQAVVATACQTYHIPLLVVADSFKFSRSVQLDSIAKNELNDSKSFRPTLQTAGKERWVLDGYEDIEKSV